MIVISDNISSNRFVPKDPISAYTHLLGIILSILGLIILINKGIKYASPQHILAFSIFGGCLILLYTASTVYHLFDISEKINLLLRKIDHIMIYALIAGTYTPICLIALYGAWRWSLLIGIWVIALAGLGLTILWFDAPRWLTTSIYTVMGWLAVVALFPLYKSVGWSGIAWMLGGGVVYTIGAVIYGTKRPKITCPMFGFHEIFHIFVLGGSFCHFYLIFKYIMYIPA